ncbi:hypothetical protein IMZ48_20275 [Candidatus Bathyarchaeota archaeon]|nr:hypothetical protein [Candidatus Bathyarchaeota archaeon]
MHYVRFLRQPSIAAQGRNQELSLVFVVTSDLGDSLLSADKPLALSVCLLKEGDVETQVVSFAKNLSWNPGSRVVKEKIPIPDAPWRQVVVSTTTEALSAREFVTLASIPPKSGDTPRNPLIMPAWFDFKTGKRPAGATDVCLRKLNLSDPVQIEFEEEFGDSIARHVWDGGLAAVSYLTQVYQGGEEALRMMPTVSNLLRRDSSRPLNILELGCGVGVLGIGLAGLLSLATDPDVVSKCHLLMTDVPDAEERALANIRLFQKSQEKEGRVIPAMEYENLDWEEGRQGRFSELISSKPWDLVVLSDCTYNTDTIPALVGTLSQLRSTTMRHVVPDGRPALEVFLATKQRHSSEQAVFDILGSEGWTVKERAVVELHGLPDKSEEVEFYLLAMK